MSDLYADYQEKAKNDMLAKYDKEFGYTPPLPETQEDQKTPSVTAPQTVEKEDGSFISAVGDFLKELPVQFASGIGDAANFTLETAKEAGVALGIPDVGLQITDEKGEIDIGFYGTKKAKKGRTAKVIPVADAAKTGAAGMVRSLAEFATGFIPAGKAVQALGVTQKLAKGATAAGLTSAVAMDPDGIRMSTLLNQVPILKEIIPDYMADTNPENEGTWEKRMKNGLDMLVVGGATDALVSQTIKMFKAYKAQNIAKMGAKAETVTPADAVKQTEQALAAQESAAKIVSPLEDPVTARYTLKTQSSGEVFINFDRVDATEEVKKVMQNIADRYVDPSTGAKTFEGIKQASKSEMENISQLLGRQIDRPFTAEEAVAAREIMTASAENLTELAKAAHGPLANPAAQFEFRRALAAHKDIQEVVLAGRKATAQALASWRIPAGSGDRSGAIADLLASQGGNTDNMARLIVDISEKNPEAISAAAAKLADPTWSDALYQVWVNGLLSGPATHMANIIGNTGTTVMGLTEKYLSVSSASMRGEGGAALKEANASAMGFFSGLRDSWSLLKEGEKGLTAGTKIEVRTSAIGNRLIGAPPDSMIGKGMDYLGRAISVPGWALDKSDNLFKGINYRMELHARATRQALDEGLTGRALKERIASIISNSSDPIQRIAGDFARYQTFQTEGGAFTKWLQRGQQQIGGMRYVVPFIRTPVNIFKYGFERVPGVNLAFKGVREALKNGGPEKDAAIAKMMSGSLLMAGGAGLALSGNISGAGPLNQNERRALLATGWQPYSIKMGDTWVSYARLEPVGSLLGYSADIAEMMGAIDNDEDADNLVAAGLAAFSKQLLNKTFVSGAMRALDAVGSGNDKIIGRWIQDTTVSFAPYSSLGKTVNKYFDDVRRDYRPDDEMGLLRQTVEKYKQNFGILTSDAPPLRDAWGEELKKNNGVIPFLENMSPIAIKKNETDPVNRMIAERNISISMPLRTIEGIKLTNKEYSQYSEIAGKWTKKTLDNLVERGLFNEFTDELTQQMVTEVVNAGRKRARQKLIRESLELQERIKEAKIDKYTKLRGIDNGTITE